MKNYFLGLCLLSLGASTILCLGEENDQFNYSVIASTFSFIESYEKFLRNRPADTQFDFSSYDFDAMAKNDLKYAAEEAYNTNAKPFDVVEFNALPYEEKETYISDNFLQPLVAGNYAICHQGKRIDPASLVSLIKKPKESAGFVEGKEPIKCKISCSSIVNSSLFKSSCTAAAAGLGTYFAVGFYNKGKKKEEQLSQKKWALSAAAIAGIGTFACLYYRAQAALEADDFVDLTE